MALSSVKQPGVVGISSVERTDPPGEGSGVKIFVVTQPEPGISPRAYQIDAFSNVISLEKPPFKSELIERYAGKKKRQLINWAKSTSQVVIILFALIFSCLTFLGVIQLRAVLSESMSGTFEKGDVLITLNPGITAPKINDIIVFHYYNLDRSEKIADFSHRIIGGSTLSGWRTKGDANEKAEIAPILADDVVGVVVGWIPWVGNLLQPNVMILVIAVVFVFYAGGPELMDRIRSRKKI